MIIADTNVVSELMAPSPSARVREWIRLERLVHDVCMTTVNVAEILYGIELLPRGKRRDGLLCAAEAMFAEEFVSRILSFDEPAAHAFAKSRRLGGRKDVRSLSSMRRSHRLREQMARRSPPATLRISKAAAFAW